MNITTLAGSIASADYPLAYPANTTFVWCLAGNLTANQAYFNFLDFELADGDVLAIYNGNTSQAIIGNFTGTYGMRLFVFCLVE